MSIDQKTGAEKLHAWRVIYLRAAILLLVHYAAYQAVVIASIRPSPTRGIFQVLPLWVYIYYPWFIALVTAALIKPIHLPGKGYSRIRRSPCFSNCRPET